MPLKANLKVNYYTLCTTYVLEVSPGYLILATMNLKISYRLVRAEGSRVYWLSAISVCPPI
jgi:hypothetical protein